MRFRGWVTQLHADRARSYMLTVRAASPSKLEDLLNVIHQTVPVSTETTIVLQRYFSK